MNEYNLELVKKLFNENKYKDLIEIVDLINKRAVYDKKDIDILNFLFKNKDVNAYLYETMINTYDSFKANFFQNSKDDLDGIEYNNSDIEDNIDLNLKNALKQKNINVEEYKISDIEELPRISIRIDDVSRELCSFIMKKVYIDKVLDIGFDITSLKSIEYDIFTIYLLPYKMKDEIIEEQLNKLKKIVNDGIIHLSEENSKCELPLKLKKLINKFESLKIKYFSENFRVGFICSKANNEVGKFYLATNNKEETLDLDNEEIKEYNCRSKIVSYDNKPYISSSKSAYVNTKTVGFVIFLTILVIIAVSILTLKG